MMLPPVYSTLSAAAPVAAIVGARIFRHGLAPQDIIRPYVTWHLAAGSPENTLSELPAVDRDTVQLDCWHADDAGVTELAGAVRDAIEPHAHLTQIIMDERDPETRLYHVALQFDWFLPRP